MIGPRLLAEVELEVEVVELLVVVVVVPVGRLFLNYDATVIQLA